MMDIQKLLPFILRHENVAVIEHGVLYITDRQSYPFEIRRVACSDASETADAIRRMVTQGGGPLEAALRAMVLTAMKKGKDRDAFDLAVRALSGARPTNTTMKRELEALLPKILMGFDQEDFVSYVDELVKSGVLKNLKGLLYFTDGKGIYPKKTDDLFSGALLLPDSGTCL